MSQLSRHGPQEKDHLTPIEELKELIEKAKG
jgi:hypothetical protein